MAVRHTEQNDNPVMAQHQGTIAFLRTKWDDGKRTKNNYNYQV